MHQHTTHEGLRTWIAEHRAIHGDLQELHKQHLVTNDHLAQLLARMIPPSPNGHEDYTGPSRNPTRSPNRWPP